MDRALQAIKRKLEAAELEHLRQHVAELQERLAGALESADIADEHAEAWQRSFFDLKNEVEGELEAAGKAVGMTQDGAIRVVDAPSAPTPSSTAAEDLLAALKALKKRIDLDAIDLRRWANALASGGRAIPNAFDTIYVPLLKDASDAIAKAEGRPS